MKRQWLRWLWLPAALLGLAVVLALVFVPPRQPVPQQTEPLQSSARNKAASRQLPVMHIPDGAQMLRYPLQTGTVVAGFHNELYRADKGFEHYGLDITPVYAVRADVLASGEGYVLGTEQCDNSLGCIVVIRYDNVYLPTLREARPLIARYYHMVSIALKEGDRVTAGSLIGVIDGGHQTLNHTHIELDMDTDAPFYTPQVAEASSELLHRHSATGDSILNPVTVLALGSGQDIYKHPLATYCGQPDLPRYRWEPKGTA